MENFSPAEIHELRRMLAAFKTDLPQHELGDWNIEIEPNRVTIEDERQNTLRMGRVGFGHARGDARCTRCGLFFRSDFSPWVREEEGDHSEVIAQIKENVLRNAQRSGPCWGGIPQAPSNDRWVAALDSVAAMQEP